MFGQHSALCTSWRMAPRGREPGQRALALHARDVLVGDGLARLGDRGPNAEREFWRPLGGHVATHDEPEPMLVDLGNAGQTLVPLKMRRIMTAPLRVGASLRPMVSLLQSRSARDPGGLRRHPVHGGFCFRLSEQPSSRSLETVRLNKLAFAGFVDSRARWFHAFGLRWKASTELQAIRKQQGADLAVFNGEASGRSRCPPATSSIRTRSPAGLDPRLRKARPCVPNRRDLVPSRARRWQP